MADAPPAPKICARCGRQMTWRKKWAANWESVRYCSERCRRHKADDTDNALEVAIVSLLSTRAKGATICPSEAARQVFSDGQWRDKMDATRQAARRLVDLGKIDIVQRGAVVDPSRAKGPLRLRLATPQPNDRSTT